MATPFTRSIKLDIGDSTPDWNASQPETAPEGAPNVLVDVADDVYIDLERHLAVAMARD